MWCDDTPLVSLFFGFSKDLSLSPSHKRILWCSQSGFHPENNLAKFGYILGYQTRKAKQNPLSFCIIGYLLKLIIKIWWFKFLFLQKKWKWKMLQIGWNYNFQVEIWWNFCQWNNTSSFHFTSFSWELHLCKEQLHPYPLLGSLGIVYQHRRLLVYLENSLCRVRYP